MRLADTLIAGGGPAGAAAAIMLARAGTRALLLERSGLARGRDMVCGGFLGWDTLALLGRLGIDPAALGARPIHSVRIATATDSMTLRLPEPAAGLSRRALDTALLDQAALAGAGIERDVTIRALAPDRMAVRTDAGEEMAARAILLATGKHDLRGAARETGGQAMSLGIRCALEATAGLEHALSGQLELFLFRDGYAGLLLQEDGTANFCLSIAERRIAALPRQPQALVDTLARECPPMGERLAMARRIGDWATIARVPYGWRAETTRTGLFRLGDQAGVVPSIVGDGIAIALASGMMAARSLAEGDTASAYQARFSRRLRTPIGAAEMIRRVAAHPASAGILLRLMRASPALAHSVARFSRIEHRRTY